MNKCILINILKVNYIILILELNQNLLGHKICYVNIRLFNMAARVQNTIVLEKLMNNNIYMRETFK